MRNFQVALDPYDGVAESGVTSNVLDTRDAFDFTVSTYTSAGTASLLTYQVSNWTGDIGNPRDASIPEASWSNWTTFTPSAATVLAPVLGAGYARILRTPSLASHVFHARKHVR